MFKEMPFFSCTLKDFYKIYQPTGQSQRDLEFKENLKTKEGLLKQINYVGSGKAQKNLENHYAKSPYDMALKKHER